MANYSNLTIVFYSLGNFGQALCMRLCYKDLILTKKSHNCAGIAFIQGDSAGGSKLIKQALISTWNLTNDFEKNKEEFWVQIYWIVVCLLIINKYLQRKRVLSDTEKIWWNFQFNYSGKLEVLSAQKIHKILAHKTHQAPSEFSETSRKWGLWLLESPELRQKSSFGKDSLT